MTTNDKNKRLAELLGYLILTDDGDMGLPLTSEMVPIPDYCHDLNAVHDVTRLLLLSQLMEYRSRLCPGILEPWAIDAPAYQRVDALIATLEVDS